MQSKIVGGFSVVFSRCLFKYDVKYDVTCKLNGNHNFLNMSEGVFLFFFCYLKVKYKIQESAHALTAKMTFILTEFVLG